ncbi:MAG: cobalamin biosynthesis protein [Proteobacteria bacterium]|nr:cobalamin biosynthesis protein [Pseudomonadota bacterium]
MQNKKIAIYAITKHGLVTASKIKEVFPDADLYVSERNFADAPEKSIELTKPFPPKIASTWSKYECHIYVFSLGAVIRMIKDLLVDKMQDPAVVCVDDKGKFAIATLSGHIGRGNQYTRLIANGIEAIPVLTTASDSLGTLSADILGRELNWELDDPVHNVTKACAEVVNESRVLFIQETGEPEFWPLEKILPPGMDYQTSLSDIAVDDYEILLICSDRDIKKNYPEFWQKAIIYRPKSLILGLGCDRDTPFEVVEEGVLKYLREEDFSLKSVKAFATIDKKRDEVALKELAEKYNWPLITYTAEELDKVEGIENPSDLVKKYVGTRSVAEAACLLESGATQLLLPKRAHSKSLKGKNMTIAIARIPFASRKI